MIDHGSTDRVRRSAAERYIAPARQRGEQTVVIHSGTFAKQLVEQRLLQANRFPIVCNALRSKRFAKENHLTLQEVKTSAASGQSSTVSFVFKLEPLDAIQKVKSDDSVSFERLRGVLKKTYKQLGGADSFHVTERENWDQ
jgi:hypothetical protein